MGAFRALLPALMLAHGVVLAASVCEKKCHETYFLGRISIGIGDFGDDQGTTCTRYKKEALNQALFNAAWNFDPKLAELATTTTTPITPTTTIPNAPAEIMMVTRAQESPSGTTQMPEGTTSASPFFFQNPNYTVNSENSNKPEESRPVKVVSEDLVPEKVVSENVVPEKVVREDLIPEKVVSEDLVPEKVVSENLTVKFTPSQPRFENRVEIKPENFLVTTTEKELATLEMQEDDWGTGLNDEYIKYLKAKGVMAEDMKEDPMVSTYVDADPSNWEMKFIEKKQPMETDSPVKKKTEKPKTPTFSVSTPAPKIKKDEESNSVEENWDSWVEKQLEAYLNHLKGSAKEAQPKEEVEKIEKVTNYETRMKNVQGKQGKMKKTQHGKYKLVPVDKKGNVARARKLQKNGLEATPKKEKKHYGKAGKSAKKLGVGQSQRGQSAGQADLRAKSKRPKSSKAIKEEINTLEDWLNMHRKKELKSANAAAKAKGSSLRSKNAGKPGSEKFSANKSPKKSKKRKGAKRGGQRNQQKEPESWDLKLDAFERQGGGGEGEDKLPWRSANILGNEGKKRIVLKNIDSKMRMLEQRSLLGNNNRSRKRGRGKIPLQNN